MIEFIALLSAGALVTVYCIDILSSPIHSTEGLSSDLVSKIGDLESRFFCNPKRTFVVYFTPLLGIVIWPLSVFLPYALSNALNLMLLLLFTLGTAFLFAIAIVKNREINRSWEEELIAKRTLNQTNE